MGIEIKIQFKICVKHGRRNKFKMSLDKVVIPTHLVGRFLNLASVLFMHSTVLLRSIFPSMGCVSSGIVEVVHAEEIQKEVFVTDGKRKVSREIVDIDDQTEATVSTLTTVEASILEFRYKKLAGIYYYSNVKPYLPVIGKVLRENGLENDALFIQAMFYVGQHESHWNTKSVSGSTYGGEHPTGLFQFLPSTFRSVSSGNIFNAEDQIRAYVTMAERGRLREFGTLYIRGLNPSVKSYALNF